MNDSRQSVNDLAKACARSTDAAEWEEFCALPATGLAGCAAYFAAVAQRLSPSTVDDIVQEVFLKLCEQERRILRRL